MTHSSNETRCKFPNQFSFQRNKYITSKGTITTKIMASHISYHKIQPIFTVSPHPLQLQPPSPQTPTEKDQIHSLPTTRCTSSVCIPNCTTRYLSLLFFFDRHLKHLNSTHLSYSTPFTTTGKSLILISVPSPSPCLTIAFTASTLPNSFPSNLARMIKSNAGPRVVQCESRSFWDRPDRMSDSRPDVSIAVLRSWAES